MGLLLFFAIPVATIILSIVWQRIIKSPLLVAATAFAIFLLIVYSTDPSLLIFAIIYTILSFISASIARFVSEHLGRNGIIRNIQAENIEANSIDANILNSTTSNANTLNANTLNANNFNIDNDNNSNCGCNNRFCNRNYRRF